MLSEHRDGNAARRFLRRSLEVAGRKPLRVTTDHHPAYRKAICWILGRKVLHQRSQYLNNLTEQDHRRVKQRYYPMLGFGRFEPAVRFCAAFDELRQYFWIRRRGGRHVPLADQRRAVRCALARADRGDGNELGSVVHRVRRLALIRGLRSDTAAAPGSSDVPALARARQASGEWLDVTIFAARTFWRGTVPVLICEMHDRHSPGGLPHEFRLSPFPFRSTWQRCMKYGPSLLRGTHGADLKSHMDLLSTY